MVLALALAAAIVAHEFHSHPAHRTPGRSAQLQARVAALQQRLAALNRALIVTSAELNAEREFNQLLAVPDSRLVRFTGSSANFSAMIAFNGRLMTAALEAHSPDPVPAQPLYLWWIPRRGAPVRGPALSFDAHGRASLSLHLPLAPTQLEAIAIAPASPGPHAALKRPLLSAELSASPR